MKGTTELTTGGEEERLDASGWVCPVCGGALATGNEGEIVCDRCDRVFPVASGVPILVENPARHIDEMEAAVRKNPAWYKSDQIAWHDAGPCRHHLRRRRSYVESTLKKWLAPGKRAARLLDLGCGDGANTRWLTEFAERTDACDYNLLRLLRAKKMLGETCRFCLADVFQLPYRDESFDVVFFNHVLEHIPDDARALRSVLRILRPGGLLILGVPNEGCAWWRLAYRLEPRMLEQTDHVHFYTPGEIEELVQACGFELRETHLTGWGPPHWGLDQRLRQWKCLDAAFEFAGRRFLRRKAASLYLILTKPQGSKKMKTSPLEICLYTPSMADDWEELVERSSQAWLFHKRVFIDTVNQAMAQKECSVVAIKRDRLVGVFPLTYYMGDAFRKMRSGVGPAGPAVADDLGPRESGAVSQAMADKALEISRREKCRALLVSLPPLAPEHLSNAYGASPLEPLGFLGEVGSTYILDLSPDEEELLAGFRPAARQEIKKAPAAGITVRPADRPSDLDAYYALHAETYERTGATPHARGYFEGIFLRMAPQGLCRIYAAERDGEAAAFMNMALYKRGAYFWTGCSDEKALHTGANYLLQWYAIREAKRAGVARYDVGEAFPGHRTGKLAGLDRFKSAFGAERRPLHKGRIEVAPAKRPSRARRSLYYFKQGLKALIGKT